MTCLLDFNASEYLCVLWKWKVCTKPLKIRKQVQRKCFSNKDKELLLCTEFVWSDSAVLCVKESLGVCLSEVLGNNHAAQLCAVVWFVLTCLELHLLLRVSFLLLHSSFFFPRKRGFGRLALIKHRVAAVSNYQAFQHGKERYTCSACYPQILKKCWHSTELGICVFEGDFGGPWPLFPFIHCF